MRLKVKKVLQKSQRTCFLSQEDPTHISVAPLRLKLFGALNNRSFSDGKMTDHRLIVTMAHALSQQSGIKKTIVQVLIWDLDSIVRAKPLKKFTERN